MPLRRHSLLEESLCSGIVIVQEAAEQCFEPVHAVLNLEDVSLWGSALLARGRKGALDALGCAAHAGPDFLALLVGRAHAFLLASTALIAGS